MEKLQESANKLGKVVSEIQQLIKQLKKQNAQDRLYIKGLNNENNQIQKT